MSVAALGPVVQQVRDAGDAVATRILERAADELALAASSVATTLRMRDDAFRFVLAGGVFGVVPCLADELTDRLRRLAPRSDVRVLDCEPAVGAVRLAIAAARGELSLPHYEHEQG
jgi:N-acetylglucosamine kinase-like BadF-type ATPase